MTKNTKAIAREARRSAGLGDPELVLLASGGQHPEGLIAMPETMKPTTRQRAGGNLVKRGLAEECSARPGEPVWRQQDDERLVLRITAAGLAAIGIDEPDADLVRSGAAARGAALEDITAKSRKKNNGRIGIAAGGDGEVRHHKGDPASAPGPGGKAVGAVRGSEPDHPRDGSKGALLVSMLSRPDGAGIDDLIAATGWLPHTTRAALTGLRKRGFEVSRDQGGDGLSRYRIAVPALTPSGPARRGRKPRAGEARHAA